VRLQTIEYEYGRFAQWFFDEAQAPLWWLILFDYLRTSAKYGEFRMVGSNITAGLLQLVTLRLLYVYVPLP
jgi:hypothetical protein